ncbi:ankyrin repeat-containing domain protein [Armillaria novae-zelandiae]|uniref:Ankyrin repeat-containing domain protein n=1 Tax=Armillaria novae-zelandiae TaxID=153914 RepID=A0AA39NMW9_9AGAR|nr:ankyrin repeat-containing domain protein [Armillaria novae-zelandiae]
MSDPENPPIPSAPPYGDYSHTTPVVLAQHDSDLVSHFITSTPCLATPNTLSCFGNTPLFTAVRARHIEMVRLLIAHGVDANNKIFLAIQRGEQVDMGPLLDRGIILRTPLMEAASTGQIAMVKLLMKDCAADDTLVAPDGQTALRLAAASGQHEITAFLPSRRLGAVKRIQFRSRKAIKRIKVISRKLYDIGKFFFWKIPKFFLWTIPKEIWEVATWKNAFRVGKFFFWSVPKFFIYRVPKFFLWSIPKYLITEFPWVSFGKYLWRKIKQIPGFLKRVGITVYHLLVTMANKVSEVVKRFLSLLHTIALAIWTVLKDITLRDPFSWTCLQVVWQGVKALYRLLNKTFRCTLEIAWKVIKWVYRVIVYIPKQLLRICGEVGAVVVRLGKEIIVYIRPKTMLA